MKYRLRRSPNDGPEARNSMMKHTRSKSMYKILYNVKLIIVIKCLLPSMSMIDCAYGILLMLNSSPNGSEGHRERTNEKAHSTYTGAGTSLLACCLNFSVSGLGGGAIPSVWINKSVGILRNLCLCLCNVGSELRRLKARG